MLSFLFAFLFSVLLQTETLMDPFVIIARGLGEGLQLFWGQFSWSTQIFLGLFFLASLAIVVALVLACAGAGALGGVLCCCCDRVRNGGGRDRDRDRRGRIRSRSSSRD